MLLKLYILDQFVFLLFSLPGVDVMAAPKSLTNRRDCAVCVHPEAAEVNVSIWLQNKGTTKTKTKVHTVPLKKYSPLERFMFLSLS